MKIYNITINNKEKFIDLLLKELSKKNIKYLFIKENENSLYDELHYNNKIYRFFSGFNAIRYMSQHKDDKKQKKIFNLNKSTIYHPLDIDSLNAFNIIIDSNSNYKENSKSSIPKLKPKKNDIYKKKVKILNKYNNRKNK